MSNNRSLDRPGASRAITVVDVVQNKVLGLVANFHEAGFMMIGDFKPRETCLYQLSFELEESNERSHRMNLGAECLWVRDNNAEDQYWSGFSVIDIVESDRRRITEFIGESGPSE